MYNSKERRKKAKRMLKKGIGPWNKVDLATRPHPEWMSRCFMNNKYIVMIDDSAKTTHGTAIMAMIQMHTDRPLQMHWREIQKIKNELFGEDTTAVEYFPAVSDLVDLHNIYWIWIFPAGVLPIPIIPNNQILMQ